MKGARSAEAVLVLALCLVPVGLYADFFAGIDALARIAGAVGIGWLAGVIAARRGWTVYTSVAVATVGCLLSTLYLAFGSETWWGVPQLDTLRSLATGLRDGWARMLTVALPSDTNGVLLTTPLVVSWIVAFCATLVTLRRRAILAPLLPALVAFVGGLLLTAPVSPPRVWLTVAFLAVGLVLALLRANQVSVAPDATAQDSAQGRPALSRVAFGLPIVAAATALGVFFAISVPIADPQQRFDPRDLRAERLDVRTTLSPLVLVRNQLEAKPEQALFTVTFDGRAPTDRVRVAALEQYDGALWTGPSEHLLAGSVLPAGKLGGEQPALVSQRVQIQRLRGPFLPAAGRPVRVRGTEVGFNADAGTLVTTQPLRDYRYEVVSTVDLASDQLPDDAVPGALDNVPALTSGIPPQLASVAETVTAQAGSAPVAKLRALEGYVRETFPYALERPPGHSYGALYEMLLGDETTRMGYAEQLASAFAVLARAEGFPARVAVGYLIDDEPGAGSAYEITTADAHAWPEVYFEREGWVQFEPTDLAQRAAYEPTNDNDLVQTETQDEVVRPPRVVRPEAAAPAEQPSGQSALVVIGRAAAAGMLGLLVLLALLPVLVVVIKKLRRQRRRASKNTAKRIIGAWRETTDRLRERGMVITTTQTAGEVAADARERLGSQSTEPVADLAPLVSSAIFAPYEPDRDSAQQAWALEMQTRRALRRNASILVRARAAVDPRPLLPLNQSSGNGSTNGAGHSSPQ